MGWGWSLGDEFLLFYLVSILFLGFDWIGYKLSFGRIVRKVCSIGGRWNYLEYGKSRFSLFVLVSRCF